MIYMKSHVLSAISIANRLKNMEDVVRELEAVYASICSIQQEDLRICNEKVFGGNVLMLSNFRLTNQRKNGPQGERI